MRKLFCALLFFVSAVLCLAQTPVADGPLGNMNPCPKKPNVAPDPYDPPPMQFIPEGDYEMGTHHGSKSNELPVHAVYIDAFYMDTFEVTNEEYCIYLNSAYKQGLIVVVSGVVYKNDIDPYPYCSTTTGSNYSRITWNGSTFGILAGKEYHPMVMVSWYGAVAYANWRSTQEGLMPCYDLSTWECTFGVGGFRLPTEAEYEKASRGGEYSPYYEYPWGNTLDGSKANYAGSGDPYEIGDYPWTTPVGYYNSSQYGLYDIAGNVWEWCHDWYDAAYYQYCVDHGIYYNPTGPSSSPVNSHVLRGGGWCDSNNPIYNGLRCAARGLYTPSFRDFDMGFRLILEIP